MEQNQRILDLLLRLIKSGKKSQFNLLFHKYHEADIAEVLESLNSEQKRTFFSKISIDDSVDVFEEMDVDSQIDIIQNFKTAKSADLIEKMDKDDAVDLLEALLDEDKQKAQDVLSNLELNEQIQIKRLLAYQEDTAGALMTTDYVSIPEKLTVKKAIDLYKQNSPKESDSAFYVFIVNDFQQIKGVISLRKLLLASPNGYVKQIRNDYPITVHVDTDQEDVAKLFQKYRSIVLPVVDDSDVVLGVITIDDIVEVVVEEANEDILKLSGTSVDDIENEKLLQGSIMYSLVHRLPWLAVTIIGGFIASIVMIYYSRDLDQSLISLPFILSFVPLLMGLGGNIGNQSATIIVRALAIQQVNTQKKLMTIFRELGIGLVIGTLIGSIVALFIGIFSGNIIIAICVGLTVLINMAGASFLGASLPIILKSIKIDPAVASAPFISTVLDIIGQVVYFSITLFMFYLFL